jgi:hypothetical protein
MLKITRLRNINPPVTSPLIDQVIIYTLMSTSEIESRFPGFSDPLAWKDCDVAAAHGAQTKCVDTMLCSYCKSSVESPKLAGLPLCSRFRTNISGVASGK